MRTSTAVGIEGIETKYETGVRCTNCGFLGVARLEKGILVPDSECPNCECMNTLARVVT